MRAFVVDVNVAIVANGRSPQADSECIIACVDALEDIVQNRMIVLDDGLRILREYMNHLSMAGEPGVGDAFMKWVWENQAVGARCERVALKCKTNRHEDYETFPNDQALKGFDRSDRKYVAVAIASANNPTILNAVDPDWWEYKAILNRHGVNVRFLCPQHMQ
ncbi:MAG: hypothetical protein AB1696_02590 [Planctomycetota bacterium]